MMAASDGIIGIVYKVRLIDWGLEEFIPNFESKYTRFFPFLFVKQVILDTSIFCNILGQCIEPYL